MNQLFGPGLLRRWRRIGLALLGGALLGLSVRAQECPPPAQPPTAEQMQAGMQAARDRGFLWRISKGGRTSFLYGTIHVGRFEWLFPGPLLMQALRASDVVALELDINDPAMMNALQTGMARPAAQAPLPAALHARLRAQVLAACLPEALLDSTAPEILAVGLVAAAARRDGLDPAYAIDPVLGSFGTALQKPIESLETADLQLKLLLSTSPADLQAGLERMLVELERGQARRSLLKVAQVWADSRFDELTSYASWCDCQNTEAEKAEFKLMLDDRNPGMAERIDALHAGGRAVFAAVGSLHLVGPTGLPRLMAERGYRVERVEFKP